jgi:hypothetical protein
MNRFQRSFRLLSVSFAIVRADRSLLLFPVLSALFTLLAAALIFVPAAVLAAAAQSAGRAHAGLPLVVASVLAGYAATAVATYFNVALVSCAQLPWRADQPARGTARSQRTHRVDPPVGADRNAGRDDCARSRAARRPAREHRRGPAGRRLGGRHLLRRACAGIRAGGAGGRGPPQRADRALVVG